LTIVLTPNAKQQNEIKIISIERLNSSDRKGGREGGRERGIPIFDRGHLEGGDGTRPEIDPFELLANWSGGLNLQESQMELTGWD